MSTTIQVRRPQGFDYAQLKSEARVVIKQKTQEIRDRMGTAAQNIIEIGQRLLVVKEELDHGQFGDWLETEFAWSADTAQRLMRVAETFKNRNLRDLKIGPSALYLLASPSTPDEVREAFVKKAKKGKEVTHGEVKDAIKQSWKEAAAQQGEEKAEEVVDVLSETTDAPVPTKVTPTTAPPTDATERPITDLEVVSIFNRAKELEDLARTVSDVRTRIRNMVKDNDELLAFMNVSVFMADAENVYQGIKHALPFAVCRHGIDCRNTKTCRACKGLGWISEDRYLQVPEDMK